MAIALPKPPEGNYNKETAQRGMMVFSNKAKCASCQIGAK